MPQYYYDPFSNSAAGYNPAENMQRMYERQQKMISEKKELRKISLWLGSAIVTYVVIQTFVSTMLAKLDLYSLYNSSSVFQYAVNIIFISVLSVAVPFGIVALFNKKRYRYPIVPNKRLKSSYAFTWVCFGMGCCIAANVVVNFIITFLKSVFKITLTQGDTPSADSLFACVLEIIGLAVIPALCEEFAMRCCSLQLLRKYGTGFAVFTVSIVFGLLHGNVIQFIFAFTIGLIMAFVTVKTDSIVPAIFIHMCNNGMSAIQDIVKYYAGEKYADTFLVASFVAWVVVGVIAGIYLLFKKQFSGIDYKGDSVLSFSQKLGCFLFPGMIVPFLILIFITSTTVSIG